MRDLVEMHKALADETRLRVLRLLQELGELCVCDVEAGLDITQSRASRHLNLLRQVGLVADRREGSWVYYRIAEPLPGAAQASLGALRDATRSSAQVKRDVKATRAARRSPCK